MSDYLTEVELNILLKRLSEPCGSVQHDCRICLEERKKAAAAIADLKLRIAELQTDKDNLKAAFHDQGEMKDPIPKAKADDCGSEIKHGMNCPALCPGSDEPCSCGFAYRWELATERTMHNAWRKRAEEAEASLASVTSERDLAVQERGAARDETLMAQARERQDHERASRTLHERDAIARERERDAGRQRTLYDELSGTCIKLRDELAASLAKAAEAERRLRDRDAAINEQWKRGYVLGCHQRGCPTSLRQRLLDVMGWCGQGSWINAMHELSCCMQEINQATRNVLLEIKADISPRCTCEECEEKRRARAAKERRS